MEALQLSLLSSAEMPARLFSVLEKRGVYTGARLRAQRPEVYAQCVALLQEGVTPLAIEEALGVEHRTVEAVAAAHSIPIHTSKRRMAERYRFAADRMLDLAHEKTDAREVKDLMIASACAADKWQLLEGQPTSRSVDIEVKVDAADWNSWIDCAVGNPAANGPALEIKALPVDQVDASASDSQSAVTPCGSACCESAAGHCIPPDGEISAQSACDRGGGGLASDSPGRPLPDASGAENFPTKGAV